MAIAQGSPTTYWSNKGSSQDLFIHWVQDVAEDDDKTIPLVHSISYGGPERLFAVDMVRRLEQEFIKLSARGVTVVVASGDDGVAGSQARSNTALCRYSPSFPATLPHVVSVGATMGPESNATEIACASDRGGLITTGGGYSTVFDTPEWQAEDVRKFLDGFKGEKGFNRNGRGFPDVALVGRNYAVAIGGKWYAVSGTSASAPVFAAMLTLVNGERLRLGRPPVGFVTPALYEISRAAYHDITDGTNNCCAGKVHPNCCAEGFNAGPGWDPVTGLGSVDFDALFRALVDIGAK
jgi:tripeptidyl-peptidase-1